MNKSEYVLMKLLSILFFFTFPLFAQNLEKVSLQFQWLDQFQFAGYYMAKEKGFYEEAGLDVEFKKFSQNIDPIDEVINKRATYGISGSSILLKKFNNLDVKLLASIFQSSPLVLIARKDSDIQSVQDFRGKKMMITTGGSETVALHGMYQKFKVNDADIFKIPHSADLNDLIDGTVDLMESYISNEPYRLQKLGIEYTVFDPKDYGFNFYNDILFTSDDEAKNNKDRTTRFKNASIKGWEYAFKNIHETVNVIMKKYNIQNKTRDALLFEANELALLAYYETEKIGVIKKDNLQRMFDIYNVLGLLNVKKFNYSDVVFTERKGIRFSKEELEWISDNETITMCVDPAWMPFEKIENGTHKGIAAEIFAMFQKKIRSKIELVETQDWEHSLELAKERKCDILSLVMKTKNRSKYFNFTTPYLNIPLVIATKDDVPFISDLGALSNKKITIPKGYVYNEYIQRHYPFIDVIEVQNLQEGLKKVAQGDAYGYLGTLLSVSYYIQSSFSSELKIAGKFDKNFELGVGVRNDDPVLLSIFNKLIASLDGDEVQRITNHWISVKYQKEFDYTVLWYLLAFFVMVIVLVLYRQHLLNEVNAQLDEKIKIEVEKNRIQEQKLIHQNRLAQMGEMVSMIAHQWRQPLNSIAVTSLNLKLKLDLDVYDLQTEAGKEECEKYFLDNVDKISLYVKNLTNTIDDFRNFYKPGKALVECNLEEVIDKSINITSSTLEEHNIQIVKEYHSEKNILVYNNELMQVVLNIIKNAEDNFVEKKVKDATIVVKTSDDTICICDNGGGIPEEILEKIFDPYFSTKSEKNGTGLGLYMSKTIIEDHHKGSLDVYNTKEGVCFSIKIGELQEDSQELSSDTE